MTVAEFYDSLDLTAEERKEYDRILAPGTGGEPVKVIPDEFLIKVQRLFALQQELERLERVLGPRQRKEKEGR